MARLYKLEVKRGGINAVLYYHDDATVELVDPDSGEHIEYLQIKLNITSQLANWMKRFNVISIECSKV